MAPISTGRHLIELIQQEGMHGCYYKPGQVLVAGEATAPREEKHNFCVLNIHPPSTGKCSFPPHQEASFRNRWNNHKKPQLTKMKRSSDQQSTTNSSILGSRNTADMEGGRTFTPENQDIVYRNCVFYIRK